MTAVRRASLTTSDSSPGRGSPPAPCGWPLRLNMSRRRWSDKTEPRAGNGHERGRRADVAGDQAVAPGQAEPAGRRSGAVAGPPSGSTSRGARFELLDGDAEILPGLSVIATPGHTAGHQCVVAAAGDGPLDLLIGDAAYTPREYTGPADQKLRRPGRRPAVLGDLNRPRPADGPVPARRHRQPQADPRRTRRTPATRRRTVVLDPYHGDPEETRQPDVAWQALTTVATRWRTAS